MVRVSPAVNRVANDGPELQEPFDGDSEEAAEARPVLPPAQGSLF
jgi:hypothetical protein